MENYERSYEKKEEFFEFVHKVPVMNSYIEMFVKLNPYKDLNSIDFVSSYVDLNFKKIALNSIELSNDDLTINGLTKLDFLDLQKEIGVLKGDEMAMILDKLTLRVNIPEATKDKKLKL